MVCNHCSGRGDVQQRCVRGLPLPVEWHLLRKQSWFVYDMRVLRQTTVKSPRRAWTAVWCWFARRILLFQVLQSARATVFV